VSTASRHGLEKIRVIGGVIATAAFIWIIIDPKVRGSFFEDIRVIIMILAGLPAGASALALQIDRKSEI
jgi:hypothetical protein